MIETPKSIQVPASVSYERLVMGVTKARMETRCIVVMCLMTWLARWMSDRGFMLLAL